MVERKRTLTPKPLYDEDLLLAAFKEHNINPKHAKKIWRCFIQQNAQSLDEIPELPKAAVQLINREFTQLTSKIVRRTDASDGSTTKLLIELQDGRRVESVIMRYGDVEMENFPEEEKAKRIKVAEDGSLKFKSNKRATLCVSSQVGCAMACTFCATGTMGLQANLTAGEIIEQLVHANTVERIRNVVFMGMGEPLDTYPAVVSAIKAMTCTSRFGLSPARISVSTVGVVPRIYSLMRDTPDVGLALSLHAPTQSLRAQIVPTSKAWHIDRILAATDAFVCQQNALVDKEEAEALADIAAGKASALPPRLRNRRRRVLCEYVIIAGINDSEDTAHALGKLLSGTSDLAPPSASDIDETKLASEDRARFRARRKDNYLLNVIPYNPTAIPHDYRRPSREVLARFVDIVRNTYGVHTLLRQTLGSDVDSACGQLVIADAKEREAKRGVAEEEGVLAEASGVLGGSNVVLPAGLCATDVNGASEVVDLEDIVPANGAAKTPTVVRKRGQGKAEAVVQNRTEQVLATKAEVQRASIPSSGFMPFSLGAPMIVFVTVFITFLAQLLYKMLSR